MRLLCCWIMIMLGGCKTLAPLPEWQGSEGRDHPQLGAVIDLRSGEHLQPAELVARLSQADRVLIGERHDNPDHHALQVWLLQALGQGRAPGSLLLEMLNPDQQARVSRAQAEFRRGESVDLPSALGWQEGWDWSLYGPLVRYALEQPYPLLAANLDREEIVELYRSGAALEGRASTAQAPRQMLLAQIAESHCGMLPESQLPAMLAVQQHRDRRMAERLLEAPSPAVLIAGAFHVRRDLGVPLHLDDLQALGESRVLMLAEAGEAISAQQADFVWFTPAPPAQDHCASFRKG
ncbi:ChaN family lipoprotein [Stutzerimonas azotifigens]|uniref:Iron(III) ABC transporter n=1 Tax=Stutzerimonas azotifigens TaxID=291995 RepID=A0ABR5YVP6_9GAMM|nr:ChaN family lipoprotein [Stutzerimonas azotifigens]MBA1272007.1 iron(III) ABC transporter [Stutzerimonas azotifigens]